MYKQSFGTKNQISFNSEAEYYELLGFLTKNNGSTKIVWEENNEQGAWGEEGRIQFFVTQPALLRAQLAHTAGNSSIISRVNCNEFVEHIRRYHGFSFGDNQNHSNVRTTIPIQFLGDFDNGRQL